MLKLKTMVILLFGSISTAPYYAQIAQEKNGIPMTKMFADISSTADISSKIEHFQSLPKLIKNAISY